MLRQKNQLGLGAFLLAVALLGSALAVTPASAGALWKIGMARAKITPEEPFWIAGFASRTRPAEGTLQDLWVKVLVLEAADGHLAVLVSSDLLGIPKNLYDTLCAELQAKCGLGREQLRFTASHTHSGPALRQMLADCYPLDDRQRQLIDAYSAQLVKTMVATVQEALGQRTPATLWAGEGTAGFAVNRRTNDESRLAAMREQGQAPNGPSDFTVPVLAARSPEGKLLTVVFGYAAHASALNVTEHGYEYSGDYPGYTQQALEREFPEAQAMFFQGCGSDQSAAPRGPLTRCIAMGDELAASVRTVLQSPMRAVEPRLVTALEGVPLDFEPPTRDFLETTAQAQDYTGRWARRLLAESTRGEPWPTRYAEYPVQLWRLGEDQLWIALGGEVAVDYALRFEKQYGPRTWVAGYTNDVMAYIPSRRVWEEGGYQAGAFPVYGLPAVRWCPDIEDRIAAAVARLVRQVSE